MDDRTMFRSNNKKTKLIKSYKVQKNVDSHDPEGTRYMEEKVDVIGVYSVY